MFTTKNPALRAVAVVAFLGSVAAAAPSFAAPEDGSTPSGPPNSTVQMDNSGNVATTPDTTNPPTYSNTPGAKHHHMTKPSPQDMHAFVEKRIQTLHDKLMITPDQEAAWTNVAEAMRENENGIGELIHQRHANPENMTAVDDLESYQKIAQAHADGLKKVVTAFESLYSQMSDSQKQNADKVFSTFEGHPGHHPNHKAN